MEPWLGLGMSQVVVVASHLAPGLVGLENGREQASGKTLTKKGITDMDRIASQLVKDKKKANK